LIEHMATHVLAPFLGDSLGARYGGARWTRITVNECCTVQPQQMSDATELFR
jgi:hypothetical protein